jgi:hypothetical protein
LKKVVNSALQDLSQKNDFFPRDRLKTNVVRLNLRSGLHFVIAWSQLKSTMKNLNILLIAITSFLTMASCGGTQSATATKKDIRGSWTLNDIKVTGLNQYDQVKIQIFDDADLKCFRNSTWDLPNNNYGSYTLAGGAGCTQGTRNIVWGYRNEGGETIFQFKKLQEGVKAKNIEEGYKMKIVSATSDAMVLQSQVMFENKTLTLDYQFSKK